MAAGRMSGMRSTVAIALGVLLAMAIGVLVVFGIIWPVFMRFVDPAVAQQARWITGLLAFAVAFSFYFGGMLAGYRAPTMRRLHGTLVAPAAFSVSPVVNLATGNGAFPEVDTTQKAFLVAAFLAISLAAAYVGGRRGESLYAYNQEHIRRSERRKKAGKTA